MSHVAVSFEQPEYAADADGIGTCACWRPSASSACRRPASTKPPPPSSTAWCKNPAEKPPLLPRPYAVAKMYAYWITVNYREGLWHVRLQRHPLQPREPAARRDLRHPQDHRAIARIALGLQNCLYLGNMPRALRDWGHAKDYVEMQWMMLQQDKPEDFVIATGVQYSVRQFVEFAAAELSVTVAKGQGEQEVGRVAKVVATRPECKVGDVIVASTRATTAPPGRDPARRPHQRPRKSSAGCPRPRSRAGGRDGPVRLHLRPPRQRLVKLAGFQAYDYNGDKPLAHSCGAERAWSVPDYNRCASPGDGDAGVSRGPVF